MTKRRESIAAIAAAMVALTGSAAAQGYPDRIIELVVPATPGSSADILGRVLAESMSASLGQRFVVLNKVGAGGMLGTAEAARAKPDGYTLVHTAVYAMTVQPLTERQTNYTAQVVRSDLPDLQERPGDRGAAEHLQERGRPDRGDQSQAGRPELRHARRRHHPVPVDRRALADHQGRNSTTCRSAGRPRRSR